MGNHNSGLRPDAISLGIEEIAKSHQIAFEEDQREIEDYEAIEAVLIRNGNRAIERGDYLTAQDMQHALRRLQVRMLRNRTIEDPYHMARYQRDHAALQTMQTAPGVASA